MRAYQLCPICNGDGCGNCTAGWVPEYDDEQPSMVIHPCPKCGNDKPPGCMCRASAWFKGGRWQ